LLSNKSYFIYKTNKQTNKRFEASLGKTFERPPSLVKAVCGGVYLYPSHVGSINRRVMGRLGQLMHKSELFEK
jgi:hypothetical protein